MILAPLILGLALASSPYRPLPVDGQTVRQTAVCTKEKAVAAKGSTNSDATSIANLPFAMGRRFSTLDEYLTHLKCRAAPIDLPWWSEVRPGVYQQVKHLPGAKPEVATRAELLRRFGFSK
jgi:hypothetical protein